MKQFSIYDAAKGAVGELTFEGMDKVITGVAIDSRQVKPGDLFVALTGENTDGHRFLEQAAEAGCRAALVSRRDPRLQTLAQQKRFSLITVDDTLLGLHQLAKWYLSRFTLRRVGVTGTIGKTTTKEMLYRIFSEQYQTLCNQGNYNSETGLPLTVFRVEDHIEAGIFEMGMSDFGEMHALADIVRPEAALITNIGTSHIEALGSKEGILKAKMEITDYFGSQEVLILNDEDPLLTGDSIQTIIEEKKGKQPNYRGDFRQLRVGTKPECDFCLSQWESFGEEGISFRLTRGEETQEFSLPIPGRHNALNAMLAVAAASLFDISMETAARGLAKMTAVEKRLNIHDVGGIKLIDDTYNGNPASSMSAIDVLEELSGKRKIAILGGITEQGHMSHAYNFQVGNYASRHGADVVISVGDFGQYIAEGARADQSGIPVFYWPEQEPLLDALPRILQPGDTVLVKGPHAQHMDVISRYLLEEKHLQQV